jgi:hypothetical protein
MSTLTYEQINDMVEGRTVVTEFLTTLAAWANLTFPQVRGRVGQG